MGASWPQRPSLATTHFKLHQACFEQLTRIPLFAARQNVPPLLHSHCCLPPRFSVFCSFPSAGVWSLNFPFCNIRCASFTSPQLAPPSWGTPCSQLVGLESGAATDTRCPHACSKEAPKSPQRFLCVNAIFVNKEVGAPHGASGNFPHCVLHGTFGKGCDGAGI